MHTTLKQAEVELELSEASDERRSRYVQQAMFYSRIGCRIDETLYAVETAALAQRQGVRQPIGEDGKPSALITLPEPTFRFDARSNASELPGLWPWIYDTHADADWNLFSKSGRPFRGRIQPASVAEPVTGTTVAVNYLTDGTLLTDSLPVAILSNNNSDVIRVL